VAEKCHVIPILNEAKIIAAQKNVKERVRERGIKNATTLTGLINTSVYQVKIYGERNGLHMNTRKITAICIPNT
jgi:hypothetical protein